MNENATQESPEEKSARLDNVQKFADLIKSDRKRAMEARRTSGIEKEWEEDLEHYEGIDDHNRKNQAVKGRTPDSGLTFEKINKDTGSTVFLKITRPYVDSAAARVADMLLPTDDRNWELKPTPIPDLIRKLQDYAPVKDANTGMPMMQPVPVQSAPAATTGAAAAPVAPPSAAPQVAPTSAPQPGLMSRAVSGAMRMFGQGQQAPAQPSAPAMQQVTVATQAQAKIDAAIAAADRAQEVIDNWHVECRFHAEFRKVIESAALLGTGILKGPMPTKKKSKAVTEGPDGWKLSLEIKINPASMSVNPRNFFPDPSCGENIQNGAFCIERDDITARKLKDLKGVPGYINEMIEECIEEGPIKAADAAPTIKKGDKVNDNDLFEIWYYYGQVTIKDMEAAGIELSDELKKVDQLPCVVTMVNDHIIKIAMSTLDSGEFPYDLFIWQTKMSSPFGIGVSRQMRECQRGANSSVRNLMDNAGLSAGPQIIVDTSKIEPANGKMEIKPRKLWRKKFNGDDMSNVSEAFTIITFETRQEELMNILNFWLKEAEDVTGMPMLLQGQQGSAPDTLGGLQMMNNNASAVLRRIVRNAADQVIEPHIGRYYEYLLLHGPDDAKGDFTIDARGSSALVERDAQAQFLMQLLATVTNPIYGLDPQLVISEVLKSMRFDPKRLDLTDAKKQAMAPQVDPAVQIEQMRGQNALQLQQAKAQADAANDQRELQRTQLEVQSQGVQPHIATAQSKIADSQIRAQSQENIQRLKAQSELQYAQIESQVAREDHQAELDMNDKKLQLMIMEYALKSGMQLRDIHADLANRMAQENTKLQLGGVQMQLDANENDRQRTHESMMASAQNQAAVKGDAEADQ